MSKKVFVIILLLIYGSSYSQTYISGIVGGTWDKANNPYIIKNHTIIPADSSLTINPGTKILFDGHFKFIVYGNLKAIGTQTDSILFSKNHPDSTWWGIRFIDADSTSKLEYCTIEYGKAIGDSLDGAGGGVSCDNSSITISNNTIRYNSAYSNLQTLNGGGICSINSKPIIRGNIISNNLGWGGAGGGIFCINSDAKVLYNTIDSNGSFDLFSMFTPSGGGIFCKNSSALIINNLIYKNKSEEGGGIACWWNDQITKIINNTIVDNISSMYGAVVLYWSPTELINNIIYYDKWEIPIYAHASNLVIEYNNIENLESSSVYNSNDTLNFDLPPKFIDKENSNYHLSNNSSCIDAGKPIFEFENEPYYNGRRINIGAYGNTPEATQSQPEIEITELEFTFDTLSIDEIQSKSLHIKNIGITRLNVDSIFFEKNESFLFEYSGSKSLLPGDSSTIIIKFNPTYPGLFNSDLKIITNDLDEEIVTVKLFGVSPFANSPVIANIQDIPLDQGGWVYLDFSRSAFDTDSLILGKSMSAEIYTVELNDGSGWRGVTSTVAYGKSIYSLIVPTTKDSTNEDDGKLDFRVIAGMDEGNFVSEIKSGYSVDNLKPSVPIGLQASQLSESSIILTWHKTSDTDFRYFTVYKIVNGAAEILSHTVDTTFIESNLEIDNKYIYAISATDFSGNESGLSETIEIITADANNESTIPNKYDLSQNYPNPFNPSTTIKYSIPLVQIPLLGEGRGGFVTLKIYDILGREVATLVNKQQKAGNYEVKFDASANSETASNLTTGIYFYRLHASNGSETSFMESKKMILIK